MGGIGRDLGSGQLLLELLGDIDAMGDRQVLAWGITLFASKQVQSGSDPWCAEVRGEIISVAHHVVVSNVEVVFRVPPFVVGKDVTEW
jgi:hypothetical protein